jgi:hypothetical protein
MWQTQGMQTRKARADPFEIQFTIDATKLINGQIRAKEFTTTNFPPKTKINKSIRKKKFFEFHNQQAFRH